MMRLCYANRLESLVEPLAQVVAQQQAAHPLASIAIIVPDTFVPGLFGDLVESYRAVEQFVRFRLADRIGVAANLDFFGLRAYLTRTLEAVSPDLRVLSRQDLQFAVFECLRAPDFRNDAELLTLAGDGAVAFADERRTFEIAAKLANLLYQYAEGSSAMLRKWRTGALVTEQAYRSIERAQQRLYLALFGRDGALRSRWTADKSRRCLLLSDALDLVEPAAVKSALPSLLHFFGCSEADPILARALRILSQCPQLWVYALNPCREFWENIDLESVAEPQSPTEQKEELESAVDRDNHGGSTGEAAYDAVAQRDCPALRLWARPGRELTRLLNDFSGYDFDSHFTSAIDERRQTLLALLQESVLENEPARPVAAQSQIAPPCQSVRFLACPGARREVEVVANAIWSLIQESDAAATDSSPLGFHEIAIIFPDSQRDLYLPHLEVLLEQRYGLPLNVVNRPLASESRIAQAIRLLLDLPLSRFGREEVLRLLTHPAIATGEAKADAQRWREWCEQLNIVFGADAGDFANTYLPRDVYHWDQGLRRLALGFFLEGERSGGARLFAAQDGSAYLPFDVGQDEALSVVRLVRSARELLASALELKRARLTLADWSDALITLMKSFVHVADSVDERVFACCLRALESIAPREVTDAPVGYDVAHKLATRRIAQLEAARGQLSYGGLVVGPLSALRAIPFRAVFLLGLGAGIFPDRDRLDWRDLRIERRDKADLPLAERQRYWFLLTLLAARERVFLCYSSLDPRTCDPLEPSIVVHELRSVLRGYVSEAALERMTISHPLNRYDLEYFPDLRALCDKSAKQAVVPTSDTRLRGTEMVNFDGEARQAARLNALRQNLDDRFRRAVPLEGRTVLELLEHKQRDKLSRTLRLQKPLRKQESAPSASADVLLALAALRRFLECPIQGTAIHVFRMTEDDPVEIEEEEPLSQPRAQRVQLLRRAFWAGRAQPEAVKGAYFDAFGLAQIKGDAPFGPFAQAQQQADLAVLEQWLRLARQTDMRDLAEWQSVQIGPADESAEAAERSLTALRLTLARRPHADRNSRQSDCPSTGASVRLYGRLLRLSPTLDRGLHLVARDQIKPKDFLELFIGALVLRAAGVLQENRFEATVIAAGPKKAQMNRKTLSLPTAEAARSYLADLADELLSGSSDYFLPIEAVEAVLSECRSTRAQHPSCLRDVIRRLRDERRPVSSAYGPVRNARRYRLPRSDDEVLELIERRFGPLREIFS